MVELVLRAGTDRRTRLSAQLWAPDLIQVLVDVLISLDAVVFVCRLAGTLRGAFTCDSPLEADVNVAVLGVSDSFLVHVGDLLVTSFLEASHDVGFSSAIIFDGIGLTSSVSGSRSFYYGRNRGTLLRHEVLVPVLGELGKSPFDAVGLNSRHDELEVRGCHSVCVGEGGGGVHLSDPVEDVLLHLIQDHAGQSLEGKASLERATGSIQIQTDCDANDECSNLHQACDHHTCPCIV